MALIERIGGEIAVNTVTTRRIREQGGCQRIGGDTDGDGNADLVVLLQIGTAPLVQQDFLP